jgi:hypothetical protein
MNICGASFQVSGSESRTRGSDVAPEEAMSVIAIYQKPSGLDPHSLKVSRKARRLERSQLNN